MNRWNFDMLETKKEDKNVVSVSDFLNYEVVGNRKLYRWIKKFNKKSCFWYG